MSNWISAYGAIMHDCNDLGKPYLKGKKYVCDRCEETFEGDEFLKVVEDWLNGRCYYNSYCGYEQDGFYDRI